MEQADLVIIDGGIIDLATAKSFSNAQCTVRSPKAADYPTFEKYFKHALFTTIKV